jgi:hypothetical protein
LSEESIYLRDFFEKICDGFKGKVSIDIEDQGRTIRLARIYYNFPSRLTLLRRDWNFCVILRDDMVYWYIRSVNNRDHFGRIIVEKIREKFKYMEGCIKADGLYYSDADSNFGKKIEINIPVMFSDIIELYGKLLDSSDIVRQHLLEEAEKKFREYLIQFD